MFWQHLHQPIIIHVVHFYQQMFHGYHPGSVQCPSIAEVFSFSSGGVKVLHDQGGLGAPLEEE